MLLASCRLKSAVRMSRASDRSADHEITRGRTKESLSETNLKGRVFPNYPPKAVTTAQRPLTWMCGRSFVGGRECNERSRMWNRLDRIRHATDSNRR
jgi:hypothetical protein